MERYTKKTDTRPVGERVEEHKEIEGKLVIRKEVIDELNQRINTARTSYTDPIASKVCENLLLVVKHYFTKPHYIDTFDNHHDRRVFKNSLPSDEYEEVSAGRASGNAMSGMVMIAAPFFVGSEQDQTFGEKINDTIVELSTIDPDKQSLSVDEVIKRDRSVLKIIEETLGYLENRTS